MSVVVLNEKINVTDQAGTVHIHLVESSELSEKSDLKIAGLSTKDIHNLYGKISDGGLYLVDAKSRTYLFSFNVSKVSKANQLDYYDAGSNHIAMYLGGTLTSSIISKKYFKNEDIIEFHATDSLKSKVDFNHRFLTGLRIKSVSNKLVLDSDDKRNINVSSFISEEEIQLSHHYVESMIVTKSLVNTPANLLNPETYESFAIDTVTELKERGFNVDIEVYDKSKLQNDNAGLILAVGKASQHAPRIIKMSYKPTNPSKTLALVGKGITYDTGGLNLKPGGAMRNMKKDMGGSAAVFGSFMLSVLRETNVEITAYLAVAENSVSSNAARPGDVYVAKNGISVEIDNTDAEGRLVLADALTYASEENPEYLIDIATLTGAARVSLVRK